LEKELERSGSLRGKLERLRVQERDMKLSRWHHKWESKMERRRDKKDDRKRITADGDEHFI
jgi:hypothetical protein